MNGFNGFSTPVSKRRAPVFAGNVLTPGGIIIPGLAGSADVKGYGGGGFCEEFDNGDPGFTWSSLPTYFDTNLTIKSHFYVKLPADTTVRTALKQWAPPAAFDVRAKIGTGYDHNNDCDPISIYIGDASGTNFMILAHERLNSGSRFTPHAYYSTNSGGSYNAWGSTYYGGTNMYLRLTRGASNDWTAYYSDDGLGWTYLGGQSLTFTVAKIGLRFAGVNAAASYAYCDWLRANV